MNFMSEQYIENAFEMQQVIGITESNLNAIKMWSNERNFNCAVRLF